MPGNYSNVITDNLILEEDTVEVISTSDFLMTLSCGTTCSAVPIMTFSAPKEFRIRVSFKKFAFYEPGEYLEFW